MKVRRWLLPVLWAGVMLTGTSLPSSVVPSQVSTVDKVLHFTIYAIFAVLLTRSISENTPRWLAAAIAVAVSLVFAAADEWHQGFIPGRSTELADWHADALGAVIGALTAAAFIRRRSSGGTHTTA